MPRNRTHEIEQYLSDEYHSDGGEGYGSTTQAYSRAYGRLKRAERAAKKAIEAKTIETKAIETKAIETKAIETKTIETKTIEVKTITEAKTITEVNVVNETDANN